MDYRLLLFKHPNSFEHGAAIEMRPIAAPTTAVALLLARGEIAAAPRSAFSHPDDRIVLVDEDGEKVWDWNGDEAAECKNDVSKEVGIRGNQL